MVRRFEGSATRAGASLGSVKSQNRWNDVDGSFPEHWAPIALHACRSHESFGAVARQKFAYVWWRREQRPESKKLREEDLRTWYVRARLTEH